MVSRVAKTIKEIADELGVDKQRVYRYIKKNRISEVRHDVLQKNGVKQYDEAAEMLIKQGFVGEIVSNEVHQNHINEAVSETLIDMLKKELEIKNEQIRDLNERLAEISAALVAAQQTAAAAQALHAGTIQQQLSSSELEDNQREPHSRKKRNWLFKMFR